MWRHDPSRKRPLHHASGGCTADARYRPATFKRITQGYFLRLDPLLPARPRAPMNLLQAGTAEIVEDAAGIPVTGNR